jgi:Na+/glutamate symporter
MSTGGSTAAAAAFAGQQNANDSNTPLADQSIIIGTVGVMALLVGAITARRLLSRNILSACIENETLEDDIAYDTAYTVNSDSYNTFSQGWKGDLEKYSTRSSFQSAD